MKFRTIVFLFGLALAPVALLPAKALAVEATEPSLHPGQPPGLSKGKVTGNWAKANGALRGVYAEFQEHQRRGLRQEFKPSNPTILFAKGRLVVDAVAVDDSAALLADLRGLGLQNASSSGLIVSGLLPVAAIARAVELQRLRSISASLKPQTNVGTVTSEGVMAMNADAVQGQYSGAGVRIGVLSDSFNQQSGYAADVASGDLPAGVSILDDSANCGSGGCTDEGRAMLQLAHDVAPGASLSFHTAFNGMAGFANGIQALANSGAKVVVDDVFYYAEPMFQDGVIAKAVDTVVGQGKAYFSSAGNFARMSYETAFSDSGERLIISGRDVGMLHNFNSGHGPNDWSQGLTIPNLPDRTFVTLVLQWDEPFASYSTGGRKSQSDLDVYLMDQSNGIVARSDEDNLQSGDPIEILQFLVTQNGCGILDILSGLSCVAPGTYNLAVALFTGPVPGKIKYVMFNRNITEEHPTHSSTVFGHANAAGAEAVGAAFYQETPAFCDNSDSLTYNDCDDVGGQPTAKLEYFSSAGATPILFDKDGVRLAAPEVRVKPGVVGPDGTNTTFFYSDTSRDTDPHPNFFGTSASAPHVAAVGALMLEANPALAPADIYGALETTALNMNPRPEGTADEPDGFDYDTGYGFVRADLAVAMVAGAPPSNKPPTADFTILASGLTVNFTDTSTDSDGTVNTWSWNFGDGMTSTQKNPSHTYTSVGTKTVTLTVTDDKGTPSAVKSASFDVTNNLPTAFFTVSTSGLTATFTDASSDSDGTIVSRSWNFGDTTTSNDKDPWHTYAAAGTYAVSLTIQDNAGGTNTYSIGVTVTAPAVAPTAPTIAAATDGGDGTATITWSDQSNNETGFEIERETLNKRGKWTGTTTVGTTEPNATSFTDASGTGTFHYRVRAVNGTLVSAWSAYSNNVTVTNSNGGGGGGRGKCNPRKQVCP